MESWPIKSTSPESRRWLESSQSEQGMLPSESIAGALIFYRSESHLMSTVLGFDSRVIAQGAQPDPESVFDRQSPSSKVPK